MNLFLWLIVGGIVGWVASLVVKTSGPQGVLLNIVVGIIGAFIGGWIISPLFGIKSMNAGISLSSIFVALAGAIILLTLINMLRKGRIG